VENRRSHSSSGVKLEWSFRPGGQCRGLCRGRGCGLCQSHALPNSKVIILSKLSENKVFLGSIQRTSSRKHNSSHMERFGSLGELTPLSSNLPWNTWCLSLPDIFIDLLYLARHTYMCIFLSKPSCPFIPNSGILWVMLIRPTNSPYHASHSSKMHRIDVLVHWVFGPNSSTLSGWPHLCTPWVMYIKTPKDGMPKTYGRWAHPLVTIHGDMFLKAPSSPIVIPKCVVHVHISLDSPLQDT
jgi:hypothetical protein